MNQDNQHCHESARYKRSHQAVASTLDDSVCLFNLQTCEYLALNETGSAIWECLEKPLTLRDLASSLAAIYEIGENECTAEIAIWLQSAIEHGVIDVIP